MQRINLEPRVQRHSVTASQRAPSIIHAVLLQSILMRLLFFPLHSNLACVRRPCLRFTCARGRIPEADYKWKNEKKNRHAGKKSEKTSFGWMNTEHEFEDEKKKNTH